MQLRRAADAESVRFAVELAPRMRHYTIRYVTTRPDETRRDKTQCRRWIHAPQWWTSSGEIRSRVPPYFVPQMNSRRECARKGNSSVAGSSVVTASRCQSRTVRCVLITVVVVVVVATRIRDEVHLWLLRSRNDGERAETTAEKGACKRPTKEYSQVSAKDLFAVGYSRLVKRRGPREYLETQCRLTDGLSKKNCLYF